jgi:cytochrome b
LSRVVSASPIAKSPVRVWDAFVRAFHWSLALSVGVAWITAGEWDKAHEAVGYVAGALVAARIVWGFLGSRYARFGQFVSPPPVVVAYLKAIAAGTERRYLGHNPAGAAMIVLLLAGIAGPRQRAGFSRPTFFGDGARWSSCIPRSRTASSF